MDEADVADVEIERTLAMALRATRSAPVLAARGACLFCESPMSGDMGLRWCNADCRDDWQRAAEAARRNIRVVSDE